jgi:hypothetical protein
MKKIVRFTESELEHLIRESVENYQNDSDLNKINSQFKHVEIYPNPLSDEYQVRIVSFPSVPPLSGTKEQCIADAFKLEAKAEAKLNQLIQKAREDGYSEEEIQMAVNNRLKHSDEMNESRGLGYGLSDGEKRKVRDEYSDMRKHSHYTGRGVKGKPGEKSKKTYDIFKREGDKGNPWSKTLKKGGTADWVANMQDENTNESVGRKTIRLTESDIRRMVMEAMDELDWKTYANAADKAYQTKTKLAPTMYGDTPVRDMDLVRKFRNAKADAINNKYFNGEDESEYFPNGGNFAKGEYDMPPTVHHGKLSYQPGTEYYGNSPITYHGSGAFTGGYTGPATYDDLVNAFNGDEEKARNFMAMCQEFFDYKKGKYDYKKGKGWTKDELEEAVTRAIHKYLR